MSRGLRYVGIGTLRLSDLRSGVERTWSTFATHDADIFRGLFPGERKVILEFVRPSDHVLVVGCGSGRDMLALLDLGCRVTGVDPSAATLAIARRVVDSRASTIHGFFEDVRLKDRFDVISFSWYTYSYIPGSSRRISVLRKAAKHLAPGGRILVSYYRHEEPPRSRLSWIAGAVGHLTRSDWRLEAGDVLRPLDDASGLFHYRHVFGPGEFEAEVTRANLCLSDVNQGEQDAIAVLTSEPTSRRPERKA